MKKINPTQSAWLDSASPEQTRAFLAAGEPEVIQIYNSKSNRLLYAPTLRGVRIDTATFETSDEALHIAKDLKNKILAQNLPSLDEKALGIDGLGLKMFDLAADHTFRVAQIIHLGLALNDGESMASPLEEFISYSLDDALIDALSPRMPGLAELKNAPNDRDLSNMFSDVAFGSCLYGYLVQIETPSMTPTLNKDGQIAHSSYSWSFSVSHWFYGENLEDATSQGVKWIESVRAREKEVALAGAAANVD